MINVAVIGAGVGARHLVGYREIPNQFRVRTLCDQNLDRARQVISDDPDIDITDSIDNALADSGIDLIDVCLPPQLHYPVSIKALKAGKHVICEKPIVCSLGEADQLEAAAKEANRQVFPVFQYRYGRSMDQLKALQNAGLDGKAYVASIETHWNRDADYYSVPWRGTVAGEFGGALISHAIHAHDLLSYVLGPVAEVFAMADTRVNDIETEDCAALAFRMKSGALATSSVTLGAADDTTRLRFCFEGFTAESGSAPYAPAEDRWHFIARMPVIQTKIDQIINSVQTGHSGYAGFFKAVADAIGGGSGAAVTLADGRRSITLASAIYDSIRLGTAVPIP